MNAMPNYARVAYEEQLVEASAKLAYMDNYTIITLGSAGSNCHIVARDLATLLTRNSDTEPTIKLCRDFPEILSTSEGLNNGVSVVPLVNTVGGNVRHKPDELPTNRDVISEKRGRIVANVELPIEHCLIGAPETDLAGMEGWTVHSHPQALKQCERKIAGLGLRAVEAASTSAAVEALAASELGERALAIAPSLASELYGVPVLARDIGNMSAADNITTMAIVVRDAIQQSHGCYI